MDKYYIELAKLNTSLYRKIFRQIKHFIDFSISLNLWNHILQYDGRRYRKLMRFLTKAVKYVIKVTADPHCKGLPMNKKSVSLLKEFNTIFKLDDKEKRVHKIKQPSTPDWESASSEPGKYRNPTDGDVSGLESDLFN